MVDDVSLRVANADDVPAITSIATAAYTQYVERMGKRPAPMVADFGVAADAGHIWVADNRSEVVAYVVYFPDGLAMHLENIAVRPEFAGRGIGRLLVGHVEAEALRLGFAAVELYTNAKMWENLELYPRLGYELVERKVQDGFDRVFFRKRLI